MADPLRDRGRQFFRRGGKVRGRRDDCEGCRHRALELVSARTQAQQDHRTRTRGAWSASNRPTRRFTRRIIGRVQWCFGIRCALPAASIPYTRTVARVKRRFSALLTSFRVYFHFFFHLLRVPISFRSSRIIPRTTTKIGETVPREDDVEE